MGGSVCDHRGIFNEERKGRLTYHEDFFELLNVVNALSVELELEFVNDLFHAVSPVGHFV